MKAYRVLLVALLVAVAGALAYYVHAGPAASTGTLLPGNDRSTAPEFAGIDGWVNTEPLTLTQLRGKVVLIDFWTFSCINCVRTIPHLQALYAAYHSKGLEIVGVHSPEFDFEKDPGNVRAAVRRLGVTWPVAIDSEMATWNAYHNEAWPAEYLIDQQGRIAFTTIGEGDYDGTGRAVASLLGTAVQPLTPQGPGATLSPGAGTTPELYAGSERGRLADGESYGAEGSVVAYPDGQPHESDHILLTGPWVDHGQYMEAAGNAHVRLRFHATYVYVVAGTGSGMTPHVTVLLDGTPVGAGLAGTAVQGSGFSVPRQDLYGVLAAVPPGDHVVDLTVPAGFQLFTFTFG